MSAPDKPAPSDFLAAKTYLGFTYDNCLLAYHKGGTYFPQQVVETLSKAAAHLGFDLVPHVASPESEPPCVTSACGFDGRDRSAGSRMDLAATGEQ